MMVRPKAATIQMLAGVLAPGVSQPGYVVSAHKTSIAGNAAATTTALFGGVFAIGVAAQFFRSEADMSALALGLCGGLLLGGVLFALAARCLALSLSLCRPVSYTAAEMKRSLASHACPGERS